LTSENLQRTTYRDPTTPGNPVRAGSPTRAENALDMDQYYRPLERIHGTSLHGWGVASGLSVSATLNSPNSTLTVLPGVALDSNGRHISLAVGGNAEIGPSADAPGANPTLVPVAATGVSFPIPATASGDKYLTIQFWETFDTDGFQNLGTFRYFHTPWLRLLDVAGFVNDGSRIVLAKVSLGTGAAAGQVTALASDVRQATDLPVGSIHLLKSSATSAAANAEAVQAAEAGMIRAYGGGGIDVTVPNPSDEIHLERDDGGNFAKVSLGAEKIVARQGNGAESVVIDTEAGNISANNGTISASNVTASGTIQGGSLTSTGSIIASGSVNIGVSDPAIPYPKLTVTGPDATVNVETAEILRVMRHGVSGVKNQNSAGFFVGAFEPGINGRSRLDINVAGTPSASNTWGSVPDVTAMSLLGDGSIVANGNITAGSISTQAASLANLAVGNIGVSGNSIVLDNGTAEVGGSGQDGVLQMLTASHQSTISLNGKDGSATFNGEIKSLGTLASTNQNPQSHGVHILASGLGLYARNLTASGGNEVYLASSSSAAEFNGPVSINGPLSKPSGSFQIDHPLDPANKYLSHSFVESPDMKNVYDGVAVLDEDGEAIVELPQWFEALNRDFRYQLTCIGGFAPVYIARKVHDNYFKIAGGKPEMEVSWQVTGIRQDAWAKAHPVLVEEDKSPDEHGYYLHPELHGAPEEKNIRRLRYPEDAQ
jgi:hypothetical protein